MLVSMPAIAAAAAAAALEGHVPFDEPVTVELPGGPLEIRVGEGSLDLELSGPARRVFGGEVGKEADACRAVEEIPSKT